MLHGKLLISRTALLVKDLGGVQLPSLIILAVFRKPVGIRSVNLRHSLAFIFLTGQRHLVGYLTTFLENCACFFHHFFRSERIANGVAGNTFPHIVVYLMQIFGGFRYVLLRSISQSHLIGRLVVQLTVSQLLGWEFLDPRLVEIFFVLGPTKLIDAAHLAAARKYALGELLVDNG